MANPPFMNSAFLIALGYDHSFTFGLIANTVLQVTSPVLYRAFPHECLRFFVPLVLLLYRSTADSGQYLFSIIASFVGDILGFAT